MSTSAIRFNARNPSLLARADGQLAYIRFSYTPYVAPVAEPAYVPFCDARWYSDRVTAYGASPAVVMYRKHRTYAKTV